MLACVSLRNCFFVDQKPRRFDVIWPSLAWRGNEFQRPKKQNKEPPSLIENVSPHKRCQGLIAASSYLGMQPADVTYVYLDDSDPVAIIGLTLG